MRVYCLDCVIKHLGQAMVLNQEFLSGYKDHMLLVVGHLAEASEECMEIVPDIAEEIRQYRLLILEDELYSIPYFDLYRKIKAIKKDQGCGDCKKVKDSFKNKLKQEKITKSEKNSE